MQLKDFASITASMINWARISQGRVTDFEIGSVMRVLLEAPAAEIDELYQQMFAGIREAIPVSVYRTFGFDTLDATSATGTVRVTITPISTATLIPAGTIFERVDGGSEVQYISTADFTIPATLSFIDIGVTADTPGVAGNTAPSQTFSVSPQPLGFVSATSAAGMSGGNDGETDDARQARFREYIASLQRGTERALIYGAGLAKITDANGVTTERVTSASVVEAYIADPVLYTPGLVWLYIENRATTVSSDLIERCQKIIDGYTEGGLTYAGWKAAGVQVEVRAATRTPLNVTGTLTASSGYDAAELRQLATDFVATYLDELPIGQPALRADIVAGIMEIEGVRNIVLSAPTADITPSATEKLAPGTLTIT